MSAEPQKCPLCGERKNDLFEHMQDCDEGTIVLVGEHETEPIVTQQKYLEAKRKVLNDPDVRVPESETELNRLILTWLGYPWQISEHIDDGSNLDR